jgi:apolipoprotein D and lipocalin family protein
VWLHCIEGTTFKADVKSDEAKLKVLFYVPPFLPIIPITGDYWVLCVRDDYQQVVVRQAFQEISLCIILFFG